MGECVPYDENNPIITTYGTLNRDAAPPTDIGGAPDTPGPDGPTGPDPGDNEVDTGGGGSKPSTGGDYVFVQNRPDWYDPIYTKIFDQLKAK